MKPEARILILDDERIVCDRLKPILEKRGFEVETFTDSDKAVERLSKKRFDILVTDLKMPGVGGAEVIGFVRDQSPSTRIIVITGFATADTAAQMRALGAVEFIPKPFKMSYLRDLILRMVAELPGRGGPSRGED